MRTSQKMTCGRTDKKGKDTGKGQQPQSQVEKVIHAEKIRKDQLLKGEEQDWEVVSGFRKLEVASNTEHT